MSHTCKTFPANGRLVVACFMTVLLPLLSDPDDVALVALLNVTSVETLLQLPEEVRNGICPTSRLQPLTGLATTFPCRYPRNRGVQELVRRANVPLQRIHHLKAQVR